MASVEGLYVIVDPSACRGRDPVSVGRAALAGGAKVIQWRDKLRDKGEQLPDARALYQLCQRFDAVFIVNDHADLALVILGLKPVRGAIGVHVGQKDLPLDGLWKFLPDYFVVGASTNDREEAIAAERAGANYVAVGDIFGTSTKEGTRGASPERLAEVREAVRLPVIGIGGINRSNVGQVIEAGASGAAVISAVCGADDPEAAARELATAIENAKALRL